MRVKLILFVLTVFLLSSCTNQQLTVTQGKPLVFIVDESPKVFVIEENRDLTWFDETKQQRYEHNLRRNIDEDEDELEEFEIRTKLKNVRRSFENKFGEEELIIGFDKDLDNPDFKEIN